MSRRRWIIWAVGIAAALLIVGRSAAGAYSDYLWYDSLGAEALWRMRLSAIVALRLGSAIVASLFAFGNMYAVRQSVVSLVFPRRIGNLEIGEEVPGRYLMGAAIAISILLGVVLAVPQDGWTSLVLAFGGRPFKESDPYFGADLDFFVYWLPFESAIWMWAFFTVIAVSLAVILLYALTPSLRWQRGRLYVSTYVRRHLTVLVGMLLLLLAWSFRLDMYGLLIQGGGVGGAFGYVDHYVGVPGDLLLSLITLGAAFVVTWAGFVGQIRLASISVIAAVALSLLVREIAPAVAQHSGTEAGRAARERPYLMTRASYTRRAFAVDAIAPADSSVAYSDLSAAVGWVSVWDPPALARVVDAGRGGDNAMVRITWHVSPAGLVADVVDPPPPGASTRAPWTASRIAVASADERGAPIPLAPELGGSATDETTLDAPLIYPNAVRHMIVADSLTHGIGTSLDPLLARLASAWSLQDFHILTGDLPQPHPTLVTHRDVRERVALLTPFFAQGRHVEPLLVGDSLYWAIDLYSASDTYPLSEHVQLAGDDRSYLHHSAVAVVRASTGDINVVPDSILDPIATMWVHRLPSIFSTWSALPSGMRAKLVPPIDALYAQAIAFGRYGARTDSGTSKHVPLLDGADTALASNELPFVLPNARTTALALPLIDETDRLRGLIIGTGGATQRTMWYPVPAPAPRWTSVIDRLRSVDSTGVTARDGALVHGRIRVVPVRSGVAFVQPTYHWRSPNIPALNRVAVLFADTVRAILPSAIGMHPGEGPSGAGGKQSVEALYGAMRDALARGDWAAFGRAFDALGRALGQRSRP